MVVEDRRLALALGEAASSTRRTSGPRAAAGELAVAERAGAPFAEQVVALGIVRAAGVEGPHVGDALADRAAAFEHQRPITLLGQKVGGDHAGRARADDHRAIRQGLGPGRGHCEALLVKRFRDDVAPAARARTFDARLVLGHGHFQRVDVSRSGTYRGRPGFCARSATARCRPAARRAQRAARPTRASSGSSMLRRMLESRMDTGMRGATGKGNKPREHDPKG